MSDPAPETVRTPNSKDLPYSPPLVVHEVILAPILDRHSPEQSHASTSTASEDDLASLALSQPAQDTRLGPRWHALGTLTSRGHVSVAGGFDGKIAVLRSSSVVTLAQGSLCECDITAKLVRLLGTYKGTATASGGWIGVGAAAAIQGTLVYSDLSMGGGKHTARLMPMPTPMLTSVPAAARRLEALPVGGRNSTYTSALGADCVFKGDLVCEDGGGDPESTVLDVHGFIEGNIVTGEGGSVCVASDGSVRGNRLVADDVIIRGWVSVQRLTARRSLIIESTATVLGSVEYSGEVTILGTPRLTCSIKHIPQDHVAKGQ